MGDLNMEPGKVNRLNTLFEKMVADNVNVIERKELAMLYQEFINDGREPNHFRSNKTQYKRAVVN